jgi:uncharacterized protein
MNNLEILKQAYQAFAEGNIAQVTANWAPDMVWAECTGFPYSNEDGIYTGAQDVIEGIFAKIPEYYDGFNIEVTDFVDGGDKIVMVGYYKGIWKATGKNFKANATHTWTFKNGKITNFFQAVDSAEIINPVHKAAAQQEMDAVI